MGRRAKIKKEIKESKGSVLCYFDPKEASEGPCSGVVDFCFGCKQNICDGHSRNDGLMGSHDPYEHLENPDE
jgi:hypothetical protein